MALLARREETARCHDVHSDLVLNCDLAVSHGGHSGRYEALYDEAFQVEFMHDPKGVNQ